MFDQKFSLPSTGTILGFIAVLISLGGVAYAAGALVTIVDPTTNSRAKVTAGRLEVSVDETVTTRIAAPATVVHTYNVVAAGTGCRIIATPPAGKGFIIQQVRVNTYQLGATGPGNFIYFFPSADCTGTPVSDVNPATVGLTTVTFGAGLNITQGKALSALAGGSPGFEVFVDGFSLPAAQMLAAAEDVVAHSGDLPRQLQAIRR